MKSLPVTKKHCYILVAHIGIFSSSYSPTIFHPTLFLENWIFWKILSIRSNKIYLQKKPVKTYSATNCSTLQRQIIIYTHIDKDFSEGKNGQIILPLQYRQRGKFYLCNTKMPRMKSHDQVFMRAGVQYGLFTIYMYTSV